MSQKMSKLYQFNKIAVYLLTLFLFGLSAQQAYALCLTQQEDGNWINSDSNTRSLARAELRFTCQDQILNGKLYPPRSTVAYSSLGGMQSQ